MLSGSKLCKSYIYSISLMLLSLVIMGVYIINFNHTLNSDTQNMIVLDSPTASVPIASEVLEEEVVVESIVPINEIYFVTANILNIRIAPSVASENIGTYSRDQMVEVINKEGVWFQTKDGYIDSSYLITHLQYNERIKKRVVSRGSSNPEFIQSESVDITKASNLTMSELRLLLKGTELEGIERAILDVEHKYGINAFFILAVAKLESGNGQSSIAMDKNNLFGLNAIDGDAYRNAYSYNTKSDSVYAFGKIIRVYYIDKGATNISKINRIYCSNSEWGRLLLTIMKNDYSQLKK